MSLGLLTHYLICKSTREGADCVSTVRCRRLISNVPQRLRTLVSGRGRRGACRGLMTFRHPSIGGFVCRLLGCARPCFDMPLLSRRVGMTELKGDSVVRVTCDTGSPKVTCGALRVLGRRFIGRCRRLHCKRAGGIVGFFRRRLTELNGVLATTRSSLVRCGVRGHVVGCKRRAGRITDVSTTCQVVSGSLLIGCSADGTLVSFCRCGLNSITGLVHAGGRFVSGLRRVSRLGARVSAVRVAPSRGGQGGLRRRGGVLDGTRRGVGSLTLGLDTRTTDAGGMSCRALVDR